MRYSLMDDGLLAYFEKSDGTSVVQQLRKKGYKYGTSSVGRGLYSPNWDRMLGYFYADRFYLNPSLLHHLTDITQEG